MVGKTFKGLTDQLLAWQTERFQQLAVSDDGFTVHVRPELVVEIALDGVQVSRRYPGGVALRFARVRALPARQGPGRRRHHRDGAGDGQPSVNRLRQTSSSRPSSARRRLAHSGKNSCGSPSPAPPPPSRRPRPTRGRC